MRTHRAERIFDALTDASAIRSAAGGVAVVARIVDAFARASAWNSSYSAAKQSRTGAVARHRNARCGGFASVAIRDAIAAAHGLVDVDAQAWSLAASTLAAASAFLEIAVLIPPAIALAVAAVVVPSKSLTRRGDTVFALVDAGAATERQRDRTQQTEYDSFHHDPPGLAHCGSRRAPCVLIMISEDKRVRALRR
jgi:hypothetical protein